MTTAGGGPDGQEPAVEVGDLAAEPPVAGAALRGGEDDGEDDDELPGDLWPDLGDLVAQAQDVHAQLLGARAALDRTLVEGQAGGGVVRVVVTGGLDFREVRIDPGAVDPADTEMLQDLVLVAVRDAVARVNELNAKALGGIGGLGGALGGVP